MGVDAVRGPASAGGCAARLDRQAAVVDRRLVVADAAGEAEARHRARLELGFEAMALHRVGIQQQVRIGPAADCRKLEVLGLEVIAGQVEAQRR